MMDPEKSESKQKSIIDPQRLLRFLICSVGICGCYVTYGILYERLYHNQQPQNETVSPSFLLFTQCATNVLVASIWLWQRRQQQGNDVFRLPHGWLLGTAFCYTMAMVCSNQAILYVSYSIMVLAKSCKLIPTMLVSYFVDSWWHRQQQPQYSRSDWMGALWICGGIAVFQAESLFSKQDDDTASKTTTSFYGGLLLTGSLMMDGFLSAFQNRVKHAANPPNAAMTMFAINLYAVVFLYIICYVSGQWNASIDVLFRQQQQQQQQRDLLISLTILNATVALGQVFIFLTIVWFSPMTTTIITTSRKFLTIVISAVLYSHEFSSLQWVAILTVFAGTYQTILGTVAGTGETQTMKEKKEA